MQKLSLRLGRSHTSIECDSEAVCAEDKVLRETDFLLVFSPFAEAYGLVTSSEQGA